MCSYYLNFKTKGVYYYVRWRLLGYLLKLLWLFFSLFLRRKAVKRTTIHGFLRQNYKIKRLFNRKYLLGLDFFVYHIYSSGNFKFIINFINYFFVDNVIKPILIILNFSDNFYVDIQLFTISYFFKYFYLIYLFKNLVFCYQSETNFNLDYIGLIFEFDFD